MRLPYRLLPALAAVLGGCGLFARGTPPPGAPYVATRFCGVAFDGRTKEARLSIDLLVKRPLPDGAVVEVAFENPAGDAAPVPVARTVRAGERELRILSGPLKGIAARDYAMAVRVYESAARTSLLDAYAETCRVPFGHGDAGLDYR